MSVEQQDPGRLLRRLAGRRALARLALLFERVWPALWPPLGVAGVFLCAALLDLPRLDELGLNEISINIEVFSETHAMQVMRHKYNQGLDFYLGFIEHAAEVLGPGRVRSMLMVGLEPMEMTLAGVAAIAKRGGVPVLSPFRPDPATPLRDRKPAGAAELEQTYLRAVDVAASHGAVLGPDCPPCTHNTQLRHSGLALPLPSAGDGLTPAPNRVIVGVDDLGLEVLA